MSFLKKQRGAFPRSARTDNVKEDVGGCEASTQKPGIPRR